MEYCDGETAESYDRDGFVVMRGVFDSDEIDQYRKAAEALHEIVSPIQPGKPRLQIEPEKDGGEYSLRMIEPLIDLSPVFLQLSRDPRITGPVQNILAEDVLLFEDKLNFKPARTGSAFKLHQDATYWEMIAENIITVFVHIDDANRGNGCLQVLKGCHKFGELAFLNEGPDHTIVDGRVAHMTPQHMVMDAGDVLIFGSFTPHASEPNRSDDIRRAIIFSFNPVSDGNNYRYSQELLNSYH